MGLLWNNKKGAPEKGQIYARQRRVGRLALPVQERARVIAVDRDRSGIPHVQDQLTVSEPNRAPTPPVNRTLALTAFLAEFPEPLAGT